MVGRTLGHYRITGSLGEGGMGEVYRAEDERLGRDIALKLLPEKIADNVHRLERFRREARTLAALNHPNIVMIFSVEEAEGLHFLTMELIDGETLASQIPEVGMKVDRFFSVAIPLTDALAEAHDQGIVHRDLKPPNVLIDRRRRVKVLDFGLAKLHHADSTDELSQMPTEVLTSDGMVVGTVPYMSPEQVEGKPIDKRSDIFSLGTMLYEMAAGERPFSGGSAAGLMSSILRDAPSSITTRRAELPPRLDLLIRRCLEKEPNRRYQSAHDVRHELETIQAEMGSGSAFTPRRPVQTTPWSTETPASTPSTSSSASSLRQTPSLAVLPFRNMSADPENEYFSDGLAEELINALTKIEGLEVPALSSSFQFKGQNQPPRAIGEELGVATLLQGSVRRAGNRVRISAQLINTADGLNIWSEIYDRGLDDIFAIQDEVARAIADKLQVELASGSGSTPIKRYTDNRQAYDLYLKGRFNINRRDKASVKKGAKCFQEALDLDPDYALARVGLADVYWSLGIYLLAHPGEAFAKARRHVEQAIGLDSDLAEANASLGVVSMFQGRWDESEQAFRRAIELKPGFGFAHAYYSLLHSHHLRNSQMSEQTHLAIEAEPHSQLMYGLGSLAHLYAHEYEASIRLAESGFETDPNSLICHWSGGLAASQAGRHDDAVRLLERSCEIGGEGFLGMLSYVYARAGREEEAIAADRRVAETRDPAIREWARFDLPLALGDDETAHSLLAQGLDAGMAPLWLCFYGRPFPDLLKQVGLPAS